MTKEEIIEGNRLIAEFDGFVLEEDGSYRDRSGGDKHPRTKQDGFFYDKSWDWIMPVVEKIEDIDDNDGFKPFAVDIYQNECEIKDTRDGTAISYAEGENKIMAIYQSIIEFIKHYNRDELRING